MPTRVDEEARGDFEITEGIFTMDSSGSERDLHLSVFGYYEETEYESNDESSLLTRLTSQSRFIVSQALIDVIQRGDELSPPACFRTGNPPYVPRDKRDSISYI